jgi:hypothetical protein
MFFESEHHYKYPLLSHSPITLHDASMVNSTWCIFGVFLRGRTPLKTLNAKREISTVSRVAVKRFAAMRVVSRFIESPSSSTATLPFPISRGRDGRGTWPVVGQQLRGPEKNYYYFRAINHRRRLKARKFVCVPGCVCIRPQSNTHTHSGATCVYWSELGKTFTGEKIIFIHF